MTERSESERAELVALTDELASKLEQMPFANPDTLLRRVERALRAAAAQDQKPVAYRYRSPNPAEQHAWYYTHTRRPKKCDGWLVEPLYLSPPPAAGPDHGGADAGVKSREYWQMMYTDLLKRVDAGEFSPPPAAGWDEAIEAALKVVEPWRHSPRPNFMYVADAIYRSLEALCHSAPPDSGAGKSAMPETES